MSSKGHNPPPPPPQCILFIQIKEQEKSFQKIIFFSILDNIVLSNSQK